MANIFSFSGLLLGLTGTVLVIIILRLRKSKLHSLWMLFNIAVALWGWGAFFIGKTASSHEALILWRVSYVPILFISVFFIHVVYELCELTSNRVLIFAYIYGILSSILCIFTDQYISNTHLVFDGLHYAYIENFPGKVSFLIWIGLVALGIYQLFRSYVKHRGIKQLQILYFLIAIVIGFSSGITNYFPYFGYDIYPIGNFGIVIYCIISTYAIFRYRLMDIHLVIRKGMVYSLSAGILASFFVVFGLMTTKYLSDETGATPFVITAIAALIIAILFNPLKNRIQEIIDKNFYKRTYDYYNIIQKVSQELVSTFDMNRIFNLVGDIVFSTLGLSNIYLLSVNSRTDYKVVYYKTHKGVKKKNKTKNENTMKKGDGDNKQEPILNMHSEFIDLLRKSDDIIIKDELPGIVEVFGEKTIDDIQNTMKSFDGEVLVPVFVDNKLAVLMILGEKLSGNIFTRQDINLLVTVSNQTAVALKNARLYAEKLGADRFASMGLMSATFAHEIRNPLTSIKTFAQLMPEKFGDEEFREVFSKIVIDDIERIDRLLKDLLNFSDEKSLAFREKFDIVSFLDGIVNNLKTKLNLENRKIYVEKIYKRDKIILSGDSKKLRQAFINIITNACQSMSENGILKITINPNGKNVDIITRDTGSGMAREDVEKIFDPFYTTKPLGMGLGLAISKKIIEDHEGTITVESAVARGSTFTVSLPVKN